MAVFPYLKYGFHNTIKLFAIIILVMASARITSADVDVCLSMCLCYNHAADCTGKGMKTVADLLFPRQTKILILDGNELEEIPDLSYLMRLEKLVLSNNNIVTINSTRISNLPSLKQLDLSDNRIQSLPHNTFDSRNKLQKLDLSYNNLTDISGLSSSLYYLRHLNLQHNRIKNLEAIRINTMPKLNILRAGHNDIQELVSTLDKNSEFPRLHVLEFNNNKIERIHMFLTRFKYIRKLVLSHNKLRSINASSFINNEELEELWLDHNELSSMTNLWLTFKPKLTYLDLSYNRLHNIDAGSFQSAQHVKYLDISHNNLGSLESKIFFHLRNLSYLNLHNNNMGFVSEEAFVNLNKLLSLNISSNKMNLGDKEFDSVFRPLKLLKILDLNNNNILMIPAHAFAGLSNLKTLYMRDNQIRVIETDAFTELRSISKLDFGSNELVCDCSLKYLKNYINKKSVKSTINVVCSSPLWVKGRNITDVDETEVACVESVKHMVRPIVIENPKSKYVHLRYNATLRCVASSSVESVMTIDWYQKFSSRVVKHTPTFTSKQESVGSRLFRRSSVLKLENVGFRDAGQYWCHVANVYGSDWSKESNVTVVVRPSLSADLKEEIVARSGENVLIPCSAEGFPQPVIKFTKGVDATFHAVKEKRIVYKESKFGIENLKIEDSGFYSCIAKSSVGEANATIRLLVIEKPKLVRPMKSKSFANGTTAVIDCIISGNPRPQISWYKDGTLLKSSTSKIRLSNELLVIMAFDHKDEGLYSCQASNRLGTVQTTAHLTVRPHDMTTKKSKMASDVFISIIVVVVVVVIILTSLAWVTLICFCRRRRHEEQEKLENNLANYPSEALLSELPKNYVLKCNGKLVTVEKSGEISDEPSDALLEETFYTHASATAGHFYTIPMLGGREQSENEDDSGVSLVYPKYPRETTAPCDRDNYPLEPKVMISKLDERCANNKFPCSQIVDNTTTVNNETTISSNFPPNNDKDWRKSKPPLSSYPPPPKQGGPYIDNNSYCDGKFSTHAQNKKQFESIRISNKYNNIDFDPARLKLHSKVGGGGGANTTQTRFTNFSADSMQDPDDYYHSYVTSSSGIESGVSSENVSLNSEEIVVVNSPNGMVAV